MKRYCCREFKRKKLAVVDALMARLLFYILLFTQGLDWLLQTIPYYHNENSQIVVDVLVRSEMGKYYGNAIGIQYIHSLNAMYTY